MYGMVNKDSVGNAFYITPLPYILWSIVMYLYSDICKYFMVFGFWFWIGIYKIVVTLLNEKLFIFEFLRETEYFARTIYVVQATRVHFENYS